MFSTELQTLREHLLYAIPVFQAGFADVCIQEETGQIIANTETGWMPVFPEDALGNYFYLRHTASARVVPGIALSDCDSAHLMTLPVFLVALVAEVNKEVLIAHLLYALSQFPETSVSAVDWNTDSIIAEELTDAPEETLEAALQRADGQSLVRISLSLTKNYFPNQCLPTLC